MVLFDWFWPDQFGGLKHTHTHTQITRVIEIFISNGAVKVVLSVTPDISVEPVYPPSTFIFPKQEFGKKNVLRKSGRAEWFSM